MQVALNKIRPHTSSSLPHQQAPANLLIAIESTLDDHSSPTAYFAALLTILESSLKTGQTALGDADILPAQLYLFALLAPFVPPPVIKSNISSLLSLTANLFPQLALHNPPALRSQLSLYHVIFTTIDRTQLDIQGVPQCFASILDFCLDQRPKVRKRAQEVIIDVLASPPPPLGRHPYSERVADWIYQHLSQSSTPFSKKSSAHSTPESPIHLLALLRPVMINLPPSQLPRISSLLLSLPRLGDTYVSQSAYSLLADLFSLSEEATTDIQPIDILEAVISSPPNKSDHILTPSWAIVLGQALDATYNSTDADHFQRAIHLQKAHSLLSPFLESSDLNTRQAIAKAYTKLCNCFSPQLVLEAHREAAKNAQPSNIIRKLIAFLMRSLESVSSAQVNAIPELLNITSSLFESLGGFKVASPDHHVLAAEALLLPFLHHLSSLRIQKAFSQKEAVDRVLSCAIRILGPSVILRSDVLPLNLSPNECSSGDTTARAFLLPLIAHTQIHPSPLQHFVDYFVPLSEELFEKQQTAESDGKAKEAKIWSVLLSQIWSSLGGYVRSLPGDLAPALSKEFAQLLSNLLYSQLELRPSILKALRLLVESTVATANLELNPQPGSAYINYEVTVSVVVPSSPEAISQAQTNLNFLRSQSESWLAVLFNLYGSLGNAGRDNNTRGLIGEVISAWASICRKEDISTAYGNVLGVYKKSVPTEPPTKGNTKVNTDFSQLTLSLDLLLILLPYLNSEQVSETLSLILSPSVLTCKDTGVIKRGYRFLAKTVETRVDHISNFDPVVVLNVLNDIGDEGVGAGSGGAKRDRLHLLRLVVPLLPSDALHMIPGLITEAVLGTKEPAEKARNEAFDLIVVMGRKMQAGGVVKRGLLDLDQDANMENDSEAPANVEEFLTMIAAGLAGGSPHMISASTTAVSRVVFEFKDAISNKLHGEILAALLVFLQSKNREIVKSTLGYVKLAIHSLPTEVLHAYLKDIVQALLLWSGDRKNHFKLKVRHIFERLLRRFSWVEVFGCVEDPNGEEAKILLSIRKRKDRAKRKKAKASEEQEEFPSQVAPTKKVVSSGDAFEDVLYGSESELEDSDQENDAAQPPNSHQSRKTKTSKGGARLRIDDEDPMDLLQGASSKISHSDARRKQAGEDATHFKTDDSGKMILAEDGAEENEVMQDNVEGNAYHDSMTSVDGFTRGPNGHVKFNKDTKKRRRQQEDAGGDVDMADASSEKRVRKKSSSSNLGSEFKAKRAGGDVKKGNVDPYAYMSLSQAAKKQSGGKIGISGKRQKR